MAEVTVQATQCDVPGCSNTALTHEMSVCDDCTADACSEHTQLTTIKLTVGETSQEFAVAQCLTCAANKKVKLKTLTNQINEEIAKLT